MQNPKDQTQTQAKLDKILLSDADALTKTRRIVALGYEEAEADELVAASQTGLAPVYYEQLGPATYADPE